MGSTAIDRQQVRRARDHLPKWISEARERAFVELFAGPDSAVTDGELAVLDAIDSDLTRQDGIGLWGADEYGIAAGDRLNTDAPLVVCTYHPEIPYEGYRGTESLDEATREELNDVLWDYCERVADLVSAELATFLDSAG
ncbi:hypothetical protein OB905_12065 [Halobacteria archaeon AArc-dxtr1]|nr:hypothetical protein [Halobacteria archaeon AArc-dxtr1]